MKKVIVTGADGLLGRRVVAALRAADYDVTGVDLDTLDITDFAAVRDLFDAAAPDIAINCAAWTDVDGCARDPERALRVNGYGAQNVAVASARVSCTVVQISSNEVFDGGQTAPYREYDDTRAANPYGYSKLAAERGVMAVNPRHVIVRTAWLFDENGRNFIHAILNAARSGKPLRVVTDEVATPTYNVDLAAALVALVATERYGIYHLTNGGACSRYDFARHVLDCAGLHDTPITPITLADWPRDSTPPPHAVLANTSAAALGVTLRDWQAAVADFVRRHAP